MRPLTKTITTTLVALLLAVTAPHGEALRFGNTAAVFGSTMHSTSFAARYARAGFCADVIPEIARCLPHTRGFVRNLLVENQPYDIVHVTNRGLEDIRELRDFFPRSGGGRRGYDNDQNTALVQADNLIIDCISRSNVELLDGFVATLRVFNPRVRLLTVADLGEDGADLLDTYRMFHTEQFLNSHWITKGGPGDSSDYVATAVALIADLDRVKSL